MNILGSPQIGSRVRCFEYRFLDSCGNNASMRTFPKSLATFQEIVDEGGKQLRKLSLEDLKKLAGSSEQLVIDSRSATMGIIVQPRPVVQGFMKARFIPWVEHVALDGFYKHLDGTVSTMPDGELCEFD